MKQVDDVQKDAEFLADAVHDLHKSNLLRMQLELLVKECRLSLDEHDDGCVSWAPEARDYLEKLQSSIKRIKPTILTNSDSEPYIAQLPTQLISDLAAESMELPWAESLDCYLQSHQYMTKYRGNGNVLPTFKMAVVMPNSLFDPKDYLRNRYLDKRNILASFVASELASSRYKSFISSVYWEFDHADKRRPLLMVVPQVEDKNHNKKRKKGENSGLKKLRFRAQISFEMESLDWMASKLRLLPNRCNLMHHNSNKKPWCTKSKTTPFYNHILTVHVKRFFETSTPTEFQNMTEAVILIQIWCLKRGLYRNHDGFDDWQVLLEYLVRTKQINSRMAPSQILAAFFKCCAQTNWLGDDSTKRQVLVMPSGDGSRCRSSVPMLSMSVCYQAEEGEPSTLFEYYQQHYTFGPVLLDESMTYNYLGSTSPSFMGTLQIESQRSLDALHSFNTFEFLFPKSSRRFFDRYDAYMTVPLSSLNNRQSGMWKRVSELGEYDAVIRSITLMLNRALGDRVRDVRILTTGNGHTSATVLDAISDSDETPRYPIQNAIANSIKSATGSDKLVIGISLDPDTCWRLVDRGPSADDTFASKKFTSLWGTKAELRRFKDGAIIYSAVWDDTDSVLSFQNDETNQGGIVERITRHILKTHFLKEKNGPLRFHLRNMASIVDVVSASTQQEAWDAGNPAAAHRSAMKAFEVFSDFLRKNSIATEPVPGSLTEKTSKLGLPLTIDAVEPLSPALRYVSLYPPIPHSLLGGPAAKEQVATGAVQSEPIEILLRLGASSKWPNDIAAIAAAKTAMLIQLTNAIEAMTYSSSSALRSTVVTKEYADIAFRGYVFRLFLRADHEITLLEDVPVNDAAVLKRCLVASTHHSFVHSVYTKHASSSTVVRLTQKWLSSHLLSGQISFETIELLVCHVYTESPLGCPASFISGFLGVLGILADHDWAKEPLIVDPQHQISLDGRHQIIETFEHIRGSKFAQGPAMYIVTPNDSSQNSKPSSACNFYSRMVPEIVVLKRAQALAARTRDFLQKHSQEEDSWQAAFQETASTFRSYSALLRIDPDLLVDNESTSTGADLLVKDGVSSYTRSMQLLRQGPKDLRIKLYRNLLPDQHVLFEWKPVTELVQRLRAQMGDLALFFYNQYCPDVIAVLWRPEEPRPFSARHSQSARPALNDGWKNDTLMIHNIHDVVRQLRSYSGGMLIDIKVFDSWGQIKEEQVERNGSKRKARELSDSSSGSEDSGSDN
ncbi:U3 small nucleolar RNA-associated protein 22 [Fistulifera solaris]|uniref:U3 small nucleolar RNA-associated protein 22 n=1 Tax=Fistulifera solaris TaxID=1519565 RepID=A0A1Z5KHE1_FISSO|nr:U3 small nucleolar RNA-associated protein 22 [Fistulifera solaris]|eukprot:GAX25637.1 U3 small nucleolar RNA-associated protein 22 [Fistulifera solaris]